MEEGELDVSSKAAYESIKLRKLILISKEKLMNDQNSLAFGFFFFLILTHRVYVKRLL